MATWRLRARVLSPVQSLAEHEHAQLKQLALDGSVDWSTNSGEHGVLVGKFRAEVKDHYHHHQRRRCCYCSTELPRHKLTYDAEHILDKDEYPEYMFDEANIAVACKLCNQHKSNKSIAVGGFRFAELSRSSSAIQSFIPILMNGLTTWHSTRSAESFLREAPRATRRLLFAGWRP